MSYIVNVNSSGQATIPRAIRNMLGLVPGENRLIFDIVKGKVVLGREPSRREVLETSIRKIWALNDEEERTNPQVREAKEKYRGMSYDEVMDSYYGTPEGKQEFKERYGVAL